jgi:hypothetical protein
MEAHTKFDIGHAFVATSNDVSKLWSTLQVGGLTITATAACTDGLVRHFDDSISLVEYDNPGRAAIVSLELSGRSSEPYVTAEVSLGARYSAPISISLRGEENVVSSIRTALTDIIDGMRAWYSRIATIDFFFVWFPIFWVLALLIQIMSPSNTPVPATPLKKATLIAVIAIALIGIIAGIIWGIASLRRRFFPVATFAIGQGLHRHEHNEQVRWVVVIGFLVSVGGSIVATVLLA